MTAPEVSEDELEKVDTGSFEVSEDELEEVDTGSEDEEDPSEPGEAEDASDSGVVLTTASGDPSIAEDEAQGAYEFLFDEWWEWPDPCCEGRDEFRVLPTSACGCGLGQGGWKLHHIVTYKAATRRSAFTLKMFVKGVVFVV